MKKFLYFFLCILCLLLGVIGIVLPVMPTVPFFLAALYFAAETPQLKKQMLANRFFRYYISIYHDPCGIKSSIRWGSLCCLWLSLLISGSIFRQWWIWLILLLVGFIVSWHLLRLKGK